MFSKIILFLTLFNNHKNIHNIDTLLLPIHNGKIIRDKTDSSFLFHPTGILISPTKDFKIRSCTEGTVVSISKFNNKYLIVISSGNELFYNYAQIENVFITKNQKVLKGTLLGELVNINNPKNYIIFTVSKRNKDLNAEKYLIYGDPQKQDR